MNGETVTALQFDLVITNILCIGCKVSHSWFTHPTTAALLLPGILCFCRLPGAHFSPAAMHRSSFSRARRRRCSRQTPWSCLQLAFPSEPNSPFHHHLWWQLLLPTVCMPTNGDEQRGHPSKRPREAGVSTQVVMQTL